MKSRKLRRKKFYNIFHRDHLDKTFYRRNLFLFKTADFVGPSMPLQKSFIKLVPSSNIIKRFKGYNSKTFITS